MQIYVMVITMRFHIGRYGLEQCSRKYPHPADMIKQITIELIIARGIPELILIMLGITNKQPKPIKAHPQIFRVLDAAGFEWSNPWIIEIR